MWISRYAIATGLILGVLAGCGGKNKSADSSAATTTTPRPPAPLPNDNKTLDFDFTQMPPSRAKTPIGILKSCTGSCSAVIMDGKKILSAGHCTLLLDAGVPNPLDPPKCNVKDFTFLLPRQNSKVVTEIKVKSFIAGNFLTDDWAILEIDGTPDLSEFKSVPAAPSTMKIADVGPKGLEVLGFDPIDEPNGKRTWKVVSKKLNLTSPDVHPASFAVQVDFGGQRGNSGSPVFNGDEVAAIFVAGGGPTSSGGTATWLPSVLQKIGK